MFKKFPEFSKLTLDDKEAYEALIRDFPPITDYSFAELMTWWNELGYGSVAMLNKNLVIPYWLPGDESRSGLSLVGTEHIDESICQIFDHLKDKGERPRLINVPEFVVGCIGYPDMFIFREQRSYAEYLLDVKDYYPIENMKPIWRRRVEKKMANLDRNRIETVSLNLGIQKNTDLLSQALTSWQSRNINKYGKLEQEAVNKCVMQAAILGLENVCLFVNDELYGSCIYARFDQSDVAIYCVKATNKKTLGYEIMLHLLAKWFSEHGVKRVNLNSDYGIVRLRMFMLTLGPVNFYRKYAIEPA